MEQVNTSCNSAIDMYTLDLEELDKFIASSTRPNIKRQLEQYRKTLESSLNEEKRKLEIAKNEANKKTDVQTNSTSANINFVTVNKYALDSGDKFVKIYLTDGFSNVKTLPKENIFTKFSSKSFEVQILNFEKKNYKFACSNLSKEIEPEGSYVKQTNSGLTIFLKKAKSSDHWDSLEHKKSLLGESAEKPDMSKDPNAGLMEMMKEMYQSGDPEMKRIIAESWTKARDGEGNMK